MTGSVGERRRCRTRGLLQAALLVTALQCLAIAGWHAESALAAGGPLLAFEGLPNGALLRESTPTFKGITSDVEGSYPVTVYLHNAEGGVEKLNATFTGPPYGHWFALSSPLPDGEYTVEARADEGAEGKAGPVAFTIDTTPPQVTLTQPATGSSSGTGTVMVGGAAGEASGDSSSISLQLFGGSAVNQTPLQTLVVQRSHGGWSTTLAALAPATYTVQATQRDAAGNTRTSTPATFTVLAPPVPPAPSASFIWVPAAPVVGESVTLISSSTDLASPMTGFAWALAPSAPFAAGSPVLTTSFSTVGAHVVRLDVTDGAGRSAVATESVSVRARPAVLMAPFPVVRVAGSLTRRGALIKLLSVQVPLAARVTIRCSGHGCKTKAESRIAVASSKTKPSAGLATLSFPRFQRSLAAGVVLEIRVSKEGEIGKYTRLRIRSQRPPLRTDACLNAASPTPIPCPAS